MVKKKVAPLTKEIVSKEPSPANLTADKRIIFEVGTHKLTVHEFNVFKAYCDNNSVEATSDMFGVPKSSIYKMRKQEWWGELSKAFIEDAQWTLYKGLAEKTDKMAESIGSIIDGSFMEPKLANAVVNATKLFTQLGKKFGTTYIDPLLQTKKDLFIDNSVHNETTLHVTIQEAIQFMSKEEILDYPHGGVIPSHAIKKVEDLRNNVIEMEEDEA